MLRRYDKVLVPEMNLGQLSLLLRGKYLVDAIGYNQVNGMPLKAAELAEAIDDLIARPRTSTSTCRDHREGEHPMTTAELPFPGLRWRRAGPDQRRAADRKDFTSDQEVRWCPGCGDYAVLAAVQGFLPELGPAQENIVFVSGIGCSSRFPYYLDTYGMHSIHGRAPAIATGLATAREDLSVWVVTGDGDALSIGGNHLIHALRRNVNLKILLFNNRIYGLTKGQYSPTSEPGKVTKSTADGLARLPVQPGLARARRRGVASSPAPSTPTASTSPRCSRAAAAHRGTALVEIYQNCPIFNDGAFDAIKNNDTKADAIIPLVHGEPILFGADGQYGVDPRQRDRRRQVVDGRRRRTQDATCWSTTPTHRPDDRVRAVPADRRRLPAPAPIGIFRQVERPTYDDQARAQIVDAPPRAGRAGRRARRADRRRRHLDRRLSPSELDATQPAGTWPRTRVYCGAGAAGSRGLCVRVAAYGLWGCFPLYWPLLEPAGAIEILAHRVRLVAASTMLVLLVTLALRTSQLRAIFRDRRVGSAAGARSGGDRGQLGTYIWGVNNGRVVETSLGYFINPLVTVLMGVVILKERLRPCSGWRSGSRPRAVVVLTVDYGRLPWVALVLAFSFGTYGLAKKQANAGAIESLTFETA